LLVRFISFRVASAFHFVSCCVSFRIAYCVACFIRRFISFRVLLRRCVLRFISYCVTKVALRFVFRIAFRCDVAFRRCVLRFVTACCVVAFRRSVFRGCVLRRSAFRRCVVLIYYHPRKHCPPTRTRISLVTMGISLVRMGE
jgi:multisubunit Na+/H+ antiporter MnhE subunit